MATVTINVGGSGKYTDNLRARLKKAGVSQNQLAKEMGVPPSVLSRWFNSPTTPSMKSVERIETAFLSIVRRRERAQKRLVGKNAEE